MEKVHTDIKVNSSVKLMILLSALGAIHQFTGIL